MASVCSVPDDVEDREHALLLDEPSRLLDRLRRVVRVVEIEVADVAAEHAAVRVDVVEVRLRALGDYRVGGLGPRDRRRAADDDLVGGDAGIGREGAGHGDHGRSEQHRCELHPEITFVRTGMLRAMGPSVTRAPATIGRSR